MLGNELRLEAAVVVAWNGKGQRAGIALERLGAAAVAGVAAVVGDGCMLVVAQVNRQFGLQRALHDGLGELLENVVFAEQVFRFLVIGLQTVDQVGLYYVAFGHIFPCRRQCPAK